MGARPRIILSVIALGVSVLGGMLTYAGLNDLCQSQFKTQTIHAATSYPVYAVETDGFAWAKSSSDIDSLYLKSIDYKGPFVVTEIQQNGYHPETYSHLEAIFQVAMSDYINDLESEYQDTWLEGGKKAQATYNEILSYIYNEEGGLTISHEIVTHLDFETIKEEGLLTSEQQWNYILAHDGIFDVSSILDQLKEDYFNHALLKSIEDPYFTSIWGFDLESFMEYVNIEGLGTITDSQVTIYSTDSPDISAWASDQNELYNIPILTLDDQINIGRLSFLAGFSMYLLAEYALRKRQKKKNSVKIKDNDIVIESKTPANSFLAKLLSEDGEMPAAEQVEQALAIIRAAQSSISEE